MAASIFSAFQKNFHKVVDANDSTSAIVYASRLLSRLSCLSVQELRTRILAFIAYYNHTSNGAFRLPLQRAPYPSLVSCGTSARLY